MAEETRIIEIQCHCGNEIIQRVKRDEPYEVQCLNCGKLHREKKQKGD